MALHLVVLGQPEVRLGGQVYNVPPKRLALITYLALEGRPVRRSLLADVFWDEATDETARRNLRQELHRIKNSPLEAHLNTTTDSLELLDFSCDAADFARLAGAEALSLYRGPLLNGLEVPNAVRFEQWLDEKRAHLHHRWLEGCRQWASELETDGEPRRALAALAPLLAEADEDAALHAMRLHAGLGQHRAALQVLGQLRAQLAELGSTPRAEVLALAARIRGEDAPPLSLTVPPGAVPTRFTLEHPPLIGRDTLLQSIEQTLQAGGRLVLLEGEPGNGKTALAGVISRHWGATLLLQGREEAQNIPFTPLIELFRTRLEALQDLPEALRLEVARLLPEVAARQTLTPDLHGEGRARFLAALSEALRLLIGSNLLILEDLHWFDPSSLEVLSLLRRSGEHWRALATLRPLERQHNAALEQILTSLERRHELVNFSVPPLSETDTLRLIRALAPPGTAAVRFARRLHDSTQGNPLFLLETLRSLLASGDLREESGQWHTDFDDETTDYRELPLPKSVSGAVLSRLERLGGTAGGALSHLLGAAALLGDHFSAEELASSTPLGEWELLETLEDALKANLLTREPDGTYRFTHALVQRTVRENLSPERRRFLHRRLSHTLDELKVRPARLAPHLEGSGQPQRAAQTWLLAATDAERVYAHTEALRHWQQALALGLSPEQTLNVHLRRAETYRVLDDKLSWAGALQQAEALSASGDLSLKLRQIELDFYSGRYAEVIGAAGQLQHDPLTPEQRGWAGLWLGNAHSRSEHLEEAMQAYAGALSHAPATALELRGRLLNAWAYAATESQQPELAQTKVGQALAAFEQAGHLRGQAMALNTAGTVEHLLGHYAESAEFYRRSYRVALEIGDKVSQRLALLSLSGHALRVRDYDAALDTVNTALELLESAPDAYSEGFLLSRLEEIYRYRQQPERALRVTERWRELADQHGYNGWSAEARLHQAELLLQVAPPDLRQKCQALLAEVPAFLFQLEDPQRSALQAQLSEVLNSLPD